MAAKETGEKQIFGITIGIFAVVLVVVGTLIFFCARRISDYNGKSQKYETERKAAEEIASREKTVEKQRRDTQARAKECDQYLPAYDDVERTLLSLNNKCSEANLESVTMKLESSAAGARPGQGKVAYETIRYRGDFEGNFHQLAKFVSAVENWKTFNRFVSITAFSIDAGERGMIFDDGKQQHKVKMTLELYKYREPVAPAPKPKQPPKPAAGR